MGKLILIRFLIIVFFISLFSFPSYAYQERYELEDRKIKSLNIEERYILSKKNSTIEKVTALMEDYRIDEIIKEIENLFLDLSRVYIRLTREKTNTKEAGKVLYVLEDVYSDILNQPLYLSFFTVVNFQSVQHRNLFNLA